MKKSKSKTSTTTKVTTLNTQKSMLKSNKPKKRRTYSPGSDEDIESPEFSPVRLPKSVKKDANY